jgi:hypothetical protein
MRLFCHHVRYCAFFIISWLVSRYCIYSGVHRDSVDDGSAAHTIPRGAVPAQRSHRHSATVPRCHRCGTASAEPRCGGTTSDQRRPHRPAQDYCNAALQRRLAKFPNRQYSNSSSSPIIPKPWGRGSWWHAARHVWMVPCWSARLAPRVTSRSAARPGMPGSRKPPRLPLAVPKAASPVQGAPWAEWLVLESLPQARWNAAPRLPGQVRRSDP